jgi:hypothetical protein
MKPRTILIAASIAGAGAAALAAAALAQAPAAPAAPPPPMSFFITSVPKGDGANYGGLAGADAHCQSLAAAAGRGNSTWHAYLSTQGPGAVNARDRIGKGPWFNAKGQKVGDSVEQIHGDKIEDARMGVIFGKMFSFDEKGGNVKAMGDTPNQHDILTGSTPDGRAYPAGADKSCKNWTSNGEGSAQLGHFDKQGGGNGSWNSAHPSRGCSQANLVSTGGAGLLYCFAVN